ncbi:MAG: hypothetical protein AAF628_10495 [Planctomycetota bacterium]
MSDRCRGTRTAALLLAWSAFAASVAAQPPTAPRARRAPADPARAAKPVDADQTAAADRALRRKLTQERIGRVTFTAENGAYLDVLKLVRTATNVPLLVTAPARKVIAAEGLVFVGELRAPIRVPDFLDLLTDASDQLIWTVRDGVVQVTTRNDAASRSRRMRLYDVRALTFARTEFVPPRIGGIPSGRDPGPRAGGEADEKVSALEPDELIEMVRAATGPERWDDDGATLEYLESGYLMVHAPQKLHQQVARLLRRLPQ